MLTIEQKLYIIVPVTPLTAQNEDSQFHIDEAAEQNLRSIIGEKGELISYDVIESRIPCIKAEAGYLRQDAPEAIAYHPQETRAFYYSFGCKIRVPTLGVDTTTVGNLTTHSFETDSRLVRLAFVKSPSHDAGADDVALDLPLDSPLWNGQFMGVESVSNAEMEIREFRREEGGLWRRIS